MEERSALHDEECSGFLTQVDVSELGIQYKDSQVIPEGTAAKVRESSLRRRSRRYLADREFRLEFKKLRMATAEFVCETPLMRLPTARGSTRSLTGFPDSR